MTKELENLIQATLVDGKLEDYEKEALVKRAQKEGMDLVELEIYINAELQKRQMELREKNEALDAQYEKEKKEAIGPVCPKCGKQVPPLTLVCECGYEFVKAKKESKVAILLNEINETKENKKGIDKIVGMIAAFEVPNTKEDIVEFLSAAVPKARGGKKKLLQASHLLNLSVFVGFVVFGISAMIHGFDTPAYYMWIDIIAGAVSGYMFFLLGRKYTYSPNSPEFKIAKAWRNKFEEVMLKARSLRGDPEFTRQLDYYEKMLNKK